MDHRNKDRKQAGTSEEDKRKKNKVVEPTPAKQKGAHNSTDKNETFSSKKGASDSSKSNSQQANHGQKLKKKENTPPAAAVQKHHDKSKKGKEAASSTASSSAAKPQPKSKALVDSDEEEDHDDKPLSQTKRKIEQFPPQFLTNDRNLIDMLQQQLQENENLTDDKIPWDSLTDDVHYKARFTKLARILRKRKTLRDLVVEMNLLFDHAAANNKLQESKPLTKKDLQKSFPDAPKKPMNAFVLYSSERREQLADDDPRKKKITDFSSLVSRDWKSMSEKEKKPYVDQYNEAMKEYLEDLEEYRQQHPEYVEYEMKLGKKKQNVDGSAAKDTAVRHPSRPKKPKGAYMIYAIEHREDYPDLDPKQFGLILKAASADFKKISESEARHYERLAKQDEERYQAELEEFYEKYPDQRAVDEQIAAEKAAKRKQNSASASGGGSQVAELKAESKKFDDLGFDDDYEKLLTHPKRPMYEMILLHRPVKPTISAYQYWSKVRRETLKKEYEGVPHTDIQKMLSQEWAEKDAEFKDKYEEKVREANEKFRRDTENWIENLPEEHQQLLPEAEHWSKMFLYKKKQSKKNSKKSHVSESDVEDGDHTDMDIVTRPVAKPVISRSSAAASNSSSKSSAAASSSKTTHKTAAAPAPVPITPSKRLSSTIADHASSESPAKHSSNHLRKATASPATPSAEHHHRKWQYMRKGSWVDYDSELSKLINYRYKKFKKGAEKSTATIEFNNESYQFHFDDKTAKHPNQKTVTIQRIDVNHDDDE